MDDYKFAREKVNALERYYGTKPWFRAAVVIARKPRYHVELWVKPTTPNIITEKTKHLFFTYPEVEVIIKG